MKRFSTFSFFLTLINLSVLFLFWRRFSAPMLEATATFFPGSDAHGAFLAAQANHYALLQLYLVLFSIVLALVTFMGYTEIKKSAEAAAQKALEETLPTLIQQRLENLGADQIARILVNNKMENASRNKSQEVFNENLEQVFNGLED